MSGKKGYISIREAQKMIQAIAGTSIAQGNTANTGSTMSAPGSGIPTTGQPSNISQLSIGVRYGKLEKINTVTDSEFRYYVVFPDSNTEVWARLILPFGETWCPTDYTFENGIIYLEEPVEVSLQQDFKSFAWSITGRRSKQEDFTPGTRILTQGDAKITLQNDYLKLEYKDSIIELKDGRIDINAKEVYINNKKVE